MDTQQGAEVAPYQDSNQALTGRVLTPSASPDSHTKHRFVHLLHDMIDHSTAFKTEDALLEAHRLLTAFEHVIVPGEHSHAVVRETDRAPVEDVRMRHAPHATAPVPAGMPVIDYALLAQYIVQAQQQQAVPAAPVPVQIAPDPAEPGPDQVHVITDAPA